MNDPFRVRKKARFGSPLVLVELQHSIYPWDRGAVTASVPMAFQKPM
jgi:hypothetical protein